MVLGPKRDGVGLAGVDVPLGLPKFSDHEFWAGALASVSGALGGGTPKLKSDGFVLSAGTAEAAAVAGAAEVEAEVAGGGKEKRGLGGSDVFFSAAAGGNNGAFGAKSVSDDGAVAGVTIIAGAAGVSNDDEDAAAFGLVPKFGSANGAGGGAAPALDEAVGC